MPDILACDDCSPDALSRLRTRGRDALMLGSEFCDRLLPDPSDVRAVGRLFSGPLILATPILSQAALSRALALLARGGWSEVVVNDLGLLEALRRRRRGRPRVSCGRLLAHRVKVMPEGYARDFLRRYGISSFEVDDARILRRLRPYGLPFSWHHPFRYATVTRFCPWERRWSADCGRSCRGRMEPLRSLRVAKTLWLVGAAYFVRGQRPRRDAWRNVLTPGPAPEAGRADGPNADRTGERHPRPAAR